MNAGHHTAPLIAFAVSLGFAASAWAIVWGMDGAHRETTHQMQACAEAGGTYLSDGHAQCVFGATP